MGFSYVLPRHKFIEAFVESDDVENLTYTHTYSSLYIHKDNPNPKLYEFRSKRGICTYQKPKTSLYLNTLFSYHTPIAMRIDIKRNRNETEHDYYRLFIASSIRFSPTTSRHQSIFYYYVCDKYPVVYLSHNLFEMFYTLNHVAGTMENYSGRFDQDLAILLPYLTCLDVIYDQSMLSKSRCPRRPYYQRSAFLPDDPFAKDIIKIIPDCFSLWGYYQFCLQHGVNYPYIPAEIRNSYYNKLMRANPFVMYKTPAAYIWYGAGDFASDKYMIMKSGLKNKKQMDFYRFLTNLAEGEKKYESCHRSFLEKTSQNHFLLGMFSGYSDISLL